MVKYILNPGTRDLFMRSICCIYMFAFGSIYYQIQGLYGRHGILPAKHQIPSDLSTAECFFQKKTLLCFSSVIGIEVSYFMELLALTGTMLSFIGFVWKVWCSSFLFLCLWGFYMSIYQVGQTFLWFQWDILLLEIGFLTIIVAPVSWNTSRKYQPRNLITMWLVKWALFRLMFASGVVKLQSECPTWWGLTALNYHYESQCIPTPLSWFMHHQPEWWQKLCVAGTLVIEIIVPFLFFSPIKAHKTFAFYCQVILQISIILTGNYNFFNLLTLAMCFSLVDDEYFGYKRTYGISSGFVSWCKTIVVWLMKWIGFGTLAYLTFVYFSLKLSPGGVIDSNIAFSKSEFAKWMMSAVPFSVFLGSFSLLLTVAEALTSSIFEIRGNGKKIISFMTTLAYALIALILFGVSLVPYSVLDSSTRAKVWPVFKELHAQSSDLQISSSYGLFRRMTGVGGRPEVILEGSNSIDGPWSAYEFPSKPGSLDRSPPFIMPHQPRVDWQMWFAALGTYHQNPWLVSMSYKLLAGEKDVVAFLDSSSPWRNAPPKYIRGQLYTYHYTSYDDTMDHWWKRTLKGEYMPIFSVDHAPLVDFLKKLYLIDTEKPKPSKFKWLEDALDGLRKLSGELETHLVLWALFLAALIIIFTKEFLMP